MKIDNDIVVENMKAKQDITGGKMVKKIFGDSSTPDNPYANNMEIRVDNCTCKSGINVPKSNVKVNIGYNSDYAVRNYYAYTNNFGQIVYIYAKEIILLHHSDLYEEIDIYGVLNIAFNDVYSYASPTIPHSLVPEILGSPPNVYNTIATSNKSFGIIFDELENLINLIIDGAVVTNFEVKLIYKTTSANVPTEIEYSFNVDGVPFSKSYTL